MDMRTYNLGTSLLVPLAENHAPSVGGLGLVLGLGTRSHMPQLGLYASTGSSATAAMTDSQRSCIPGLSASTARTGYSFVCVLSRGTLQVCPDSL